ncbi:hypothetical protein BDZ45DRAFT_364252 [Acephala macrosclerotiorum]|nr:hypothetical protein BDZ45DRAFT_364252 [Acephala macrosclerotiorum]
MVEVITIVLSVGSVLSVCLHLSHGLHELQAKKQFQASLDITALSTNCLTTASLLSQLQSMMLERFGTLCTAASAEYNWMASIETAIIGIASTLSLLDSEIYKLSTIRHSTELAQEDLLDGSLVREIEQQIRGHRFSIEFLTEFLKTECLKFQLIPGFHLQPPDGANALKLEELERRSLEAKAFRSSKLKGVISEKRTDFDAESKVTLESTETFRICKEQSINNSFEPQFSLEVIEKLFQVTREHTEVWDREFLLYRSLEKFNYTN